MLRDQRVFATSANQLAAQNLVAAAAKCGFMELLKRQRNLVRFGLDKMTIVLGCKVRAQKACVQGKPDTNCASHCTPLLNACCLIQPLTKSPSALVRVQRLGSPPYIFTSSYARESPWYKRVLLCHSLSS